MLFVSRIVLRKTTSHFCWKCSLSHALSYAKPLRTFAGNALCLTHCPTQNRFARLLEMLFVSRIVLRKTASHFCWKCSLCHSFPYAKQLYTLAENALCLTHCPTQNRFALLLEMLFVSRILLRKTAPHSCWKCSLSHALSYAKPLRTFAGNALDRDFAAALLGDGDYRRANRHVI